MSISEFAVWPLEVYTFNIMFTLVAECVCVELYTCLNSKLMLISTHIVLRYFVRTKPIQHMVRENHHGKRANDILDCCFQGPTPLP